VLSEVKTDRLVESRKNGSILGFQTMLRLFRYPGPRHFLVGVFPATAERDGAAATPTKAESFIKTVIMYLVWLCNFILLHARIALNSLTLGSPRLK